MTASDVVLSERNGPIDRPCYSVRLLQPFAELLNGMGPSPGLELRLPEDRDERIPIAIAHRLLEHSLQVTGDRDIGLKAARRLSFGDAGALDYLLASDRTVGDAITVAGRYMRLINDALDVRLERSGGRARLVLESSVVLPRAASDFLLGGWFQNHIREWLGERLERVEVHFAHAAPADAREYALTFVGAQCRFESAFAGFVFDSDDLERPLGRADSRLRDVIQRHADRLLAELPKVQSTTEEVRALLLEELRGGNPGVAHISKRLAVSPRTLGRKLEREGTTFKSLLDDLRRRLALEYVGGHDLELSQIALLLGFSQTAAFHRAFRRWTGRTPLEYRRARLR